MNNIPQAEIVAWQSVRAVFNEKYIYGNNFHDTKKFSTRRKVLLCLRGRRQK